MRNQLVVHELNRVGYKEAFAYQMSLREKVKNSTATPFHLVFCEHDSVLTKGRNFESASLLYPEEFYSEKNIALENVDRGGDITYHGPGQITAYFIFDLNLLKKDIHLFINNLEEVVIKCLKEFGVDSHRSSVNSGVWVGGDKICAIGVGFKHWISYHGIGFNINTDLSFFKYIVPCGLKENGVTTLKKVLNSKEDISITTVKQKLIEATTQVFNFQNEPLSTGIK